MTAERDALLYSRHLAQMVLDQHPFAADAALAIRHIDKAIEGIDAERERIKNDRIMKSICSAILLAMIAAMIWQHV